LKTAYLTVPFVELNFPDVFILNSGETREITSNSTFKGLLLLNNATMTVKAGVHIEFAGNVALNGTSKLIFEPGSSYNVQQQNSLQYQMNVFDDALFYASRFV
jgi:hypothetical protein